jgi:hypothetical protein
MCNGCGNNIPPIFYFILPETVEIACCSSETEAFYGGNSTYTPPEGFTGGNSTTSYDAYFGGGA